MDRRKARFKKMELYITAALCLNLIIFIAYLVFAGMGLVTPKIIFAIVCIGISAAVLYQLFTTRELLRRRSLWMTLAAACMIICILFSLILKFPSPPLHDPSGITITKKAEG